MVALDAVDRRRAGRAGPAGGAVRDAADLGAGGGARHAVRALPVRRVRRAAAAAGLGPGDRHADRPAGRAAAGGDQRRHDPRPRAVRRLPRRRRGRARPPGRRARRGDGLRVAGRRRVPARLDVLADRGHHPRPGAGHPGAGAAGEDAVLEGRRAGPAGGAGPGARRVPARGVLGAAGGRRPRGPSAAGLDEWGAANLLAYLAEQKAGHRPPARRPDAAGRAVPRRARRLAAGRALAVRRAGQRAVGAGASPPGCASATASTSQSMHSDDGIVLRLPDTDGEPPAAEVALFEPGRDRARWSPPRSAARRCSPSRFRECAARALLLPRATRAGARRCGSSGSGPRSCSRSPASTARSRSCWRRMRECLQDVFDVPGLVELMRDLRSRTVRLVEVRDRRSRRRSPGRCCSATSASSCTRATRRWPSGGPRRCRSTPRCWPSCSARPSCASCSTPTRWPRSRRELQRLPEDRRASRDVDGAADLLRLLGDLTTAEALARGRDAGLAGRAGGGPAGDPGAHRRRGALGRDRGRRPAARRARRAAAGRGAGGVHRAGAPTRSATSSRRYARTHGPFHAGRRAPPGSGSASRSSTATLQRLAGDRPGGRPASSGPAASGTEWCDAEVLRTLRRRSLAKLRKEVEPVPTAALARFLPAWQGVGVAGCAAPTACCAVVEQLAGALVPAVGAGDRWCCRPGSPTTPPPCSTS